MTVTIPVRPRPSSGRLQVFGLGLALVSVGAALAPTTLAQAAQLARPPLAAAVEPGFPLRLLADDGDSLRLQPDPTLLTALQARESVRFELPLPGGGAAEVVLQRLRITTDDARLHVNGSPVTAPADLDITLWTGQVTDGGACFFAFSKHGSRGWLATEGRLIHLLAERGPSGGFADGTARLVDEHVLRDGSRSGVSACQALPGPDATPLPRPISSGAADGGLGVTSGFLPLLECRVAVETDWQFTQVFGDVDAARAYAVALFGAVSARYREQIGVILTLPYLGLYSTPADPWHWPDNGGSSIDVLFEFQDAWGFFGSPPVATDLSHFLSGANLGGGVAYLPALCDPQYGFGVSGNISGATPFPVAVGVLNWDFLVVAHELGHNFNGPHTHDYCPPLDRCAPDGWFGGCQSEHVCTSEGTLMSYCHLCDGGLINITTWFHPQSVQDMRAYAVGSCLQPFEGLLSADLGLAKPPPGGGPAPVLQMSYASGPDLVLLNLSEAPPSQAALLMISPQLVLLPFKGGILVPDADLIVPLLTDGSGALALALPVDLQAPDGLDFYAQVWIAAGGGEVASSNGLACELIRP